MARMTGGGALVEMLRRHGVDTLFALPGVQNDALFVALYDAGEAMRVIHPRHEQAAAYMAFGYARASGRPGAYAVVPGPGVLNTTAALATAYATNAPVLCLSGQIPSNLIGRGFGLLHEVPDQLAILKGLTKWAARIDHPSETGKRVNDAFRQMADGRPRPVALEMPLDMMALETEVALPDPEPPLPAPVVDEELIAQAAKLLAGAKHPLIYVGSGAMHAGAEVLARLEETLGPQCEYLAAIRAELPDEGIYVEDLTQVAYVGRLAFPVYAPRTYIHSGYQGTLGHCYATALGAKVARPDKPVVSISGDGGFMYNVQELATAALHGIDVVAIVFADGAYGNVRRMQKNDYGNKLIAVDLLNPNFPKMADSYGIAGVRATSPAELRRELAAALKWRGPSLIEVPVGEMPDPWPTLVMPRVRGR